MAVGAVTGRHEEVVYYQVGDAYELMDVFTENTEKPRRDVREEIYREQGNHEERIVLQLGNGL